MWAFAAKDRVYLCAWCTVNVGLHITDGRNMYYTIPFSSSPSLRLWSILYKCTMTTYFFVCEINHCIFWITFYYLSMFYFVSIHFLSVLFIHFRLDCNVGMREWGMEYKLRDTKWEMEAKNLCQHCVYTWTTTVESSSA